MATMPRRTYTTLSSRGLRHDILPMRLYHKAKKLGTWDPRDIDLSQDCLDWQQLAEDPRTRLRNLILSFQAGEEAVTLDLLPLIMTVAREGRLEEELFLTTFLWEEGKHTEFFRRILDEVMQAEGDLHGVRTANNTRDLFSDDLPREMNLLLTDPSPANQARASVLYNMIVEGVLAETGYFSFFRLLTQNNIMPGLQQGIQYIKRDESRHIAYGVFLISRLVAQDKSLWPVVEDRMNELFGAIQSDQQQNGTPEAVRDYARQQFEKRLARIARARNQTLEQVYQSSDIEETPVS
ncbi:R2-like ligand-binding oxidase [Ktedonobacter robiniae]|uniref:R2-like ligand binding oxidase n=1 Tax=Ktedonobacter robiniae TaxID=2778365 RepID=A0ABQ3UXG3_9CHLR|nr:R2-like ligand-binding oxidase [Ktedonobacter robiniae]GHO57353.1 ribonucleotide-diphosphate reductase [Ktedonobacter robiniae]